MGRKIKTETDWSLDKGNEVGDIVQLAQFTHTSLGPVSFLGQAPTHDYYADLVNQAYENSKDLHDKVLELPVIEGLNARHLLDDSLLSDIYKNGSNLTVNLYLMFEHLALHIGITIFRSTDVELFQEFEAKELKDKMKQILEALNVSGLVKSEGFGVLFSDIMKARHAINHPKGDNIYSVDENRWDDVPIAWFVSGKHIEACKKIIGFYNQIVDEWIKYSEQHKKPGVIKLDGPIVYQNSSFTKKRK